MPENDQIEAETVKEAVRPDLWTILKVWFAIGGQSFGGGPSTIFLIRREFIAKRGWLTEEDYARFWVLCQLTPGINLIALTVLVGKKLHGAGGIAMSLAGMLLPSAGITTLLAAGFSTAQSWPPIQAMLKGVEPATAGIMLVVAVQFAIPLLQRAKSEGRASMILTLVMIGACATLVGLLKLPVVFVLVGSGTVGAVGFARIWLAKA